MKHYPVSIVVCITGAGINENGLMFADVAKRLWPDEDKPKSFNMHQKN